MTRLSSAAFERGCMDASTAAVHVLNMTKRRRNFIKEWREYRGMTQRQLGEAIDKSDATISLLEGGKIHYTEQHLEPIADILGCSPADLLLGPPTGEEDIRAIFNRATPEQQKAILRVIKSLITKDE